MKKKCIIIAGPTAVGKTAIAIQLAQHLDTCIISADSRQCYKELNIGVARPSPAEHAAVPHYFINSHSIHQTVSAADFEQYALHAAQEIFREHDTVVMVGGTGLYIRAFAEGLDPLPPSDQAIRNELNSLFQEQGIRGLQDLLEKEDPLFFANGEIANPHRVMRALEIKSQTGKSILAWQSGKKVTRDFDIQQICLELPNDILRKRIENRVQQMREAGLEDEAKALFPYKDLNALQTVGYTELFEHFEGRHSVDKAFDLINIHTRQYAKRQVTWFKKQEAMQTCTASYDEVLKLL